MSRYMLIFVVVLQYKHTVIQLTQEHVLDAYTSPYWLTLMLVFPCWLVIEDLIKNLRIYKCDIYIMIYQEFSLSAAGADPACSIE